MSAVVSLVRAQFLLTSRSRADRNVFEERDLTLDIGRKLGTEDGAIKKEVPSMLGVDEDMRSWSYFEILEHNVIVNRRITEAMDFCAGKAAAPDPDFDIKRDVMPSPEAGPEQFVAFEHSVADHIRAVSAIDVLRGTRRLDHPIFGPLDAHRWHCLFGFHLKLHRRQAEALETIVRAKEHL